ncbi:MAG: radical SAM protein [Thermoplasmata archaeon]|nr:MAG: radical SAM protein [Thermoplasmata archaeon]
MDLIKPFDPWEGTLCTCRNKYSLNPYTGCSHQCIYCYITSYIPKAFNCRPKKDLLGRVTKDLKKIDKKPISMSNSSDPYPPIERKLKQTRGVLKILSKKQHPTLIVTKSDIVVRDIDILREMPSVVMFSITTLGKTSTKLEPNAPSPQRRLEALVKLRKKNIPAGIRFDPLIPGISQDIEDVVISAKKAGALHITASTFKPRADSWKRFERTFPEIAQKTKRLYFEEGERIQGSRYLPKELRHRMLSQVRELVLENDMTFGVCREGLNLNTAGSCDGSHLL